MVIEILLPHGTEFQTNRHMDKEEACPTCFSASAIRFAARKVVAGLHGYAAEGLDNMEPNEIAKITLKLRNQDAKRWSKEYRAAIQGIIGADKLQNFPYL